MLREVDGRVGRYAFAHALVRATLYDGLSSLRRARLHSRVGETILARHRDDLDPWLPQLALPLRARGAGRGPAAGDRLRARRRPPRRPAAGVGGGGRALPRRAAGAAGDERGARPHRRRAAARARRLRGAGGARGRARVVRAGARGRARARGPGAAGARGARRGRAVVDARRARTRRSSRVLEEALAGLGEEDSPLRARLLARLSLELYYAGQPERRLALSEEAVAIARRIGDPATLASALDARHYVLWRPENVEERLEVAAELRRIAAEMRRPRARAGGRGLDGRGPARARRRRRRRRPDRGRRGARRGRAAAAVPVVDVAVPLHARAARGRVRRGRAAGQRDARDRPARARRERPALLRDGDVQHPPRAGAAGRGRGGGRALHRDVPGDPGVALHAGADARRAGAARRGARGVRGGRSPSPRSRATPTG